MEVSRLVFKLPGRTVLLVGMLSAGLFAHTIFLVNEFNRTSSLSDYPPVLSNWFQWIVLAAWGLASACLILTIRNPNRSMGLFLIPVILGLIGAGQLFRDAESFSPRTTLNIWGTIHGISQLVAATFISLGFAFGLMYLVQSNRLKKHRGIPKFRLPTLEFLQSMNRLSLFVSAASLAVGLTSGILLNSNREVPLTWLSSGNLVTFALCVWTLIASSLELFNSGSLGGRRSAYLVISNLVFLVCVMVVLMLSSHGQPDVPNKNANSSLNENAEATPQ